MSISRLTDKTVSGAKAATGERRELWDQATPGLCLRVSNNGKQVKKVWIWRYRTLDGRQPRLTLGDYSAKHGLKWAREEVEELRVRVRKGDDPAGDRRKARAEALLQPLRTFDHLAEAYLEACEKGHWKPRRKQKRARTLKDERAVLDRNIRPVLGKLRLEDIDRRTIRKLLNDMLDRGIRAQTNKTHAVIRQVFAYAIDQERLGANPAAGIDKPADDVPRTRFLTDQELERLWCTLTRWPNDMRLPARPGEPEGRRVYVGRPMRIALQLAALLLVRRNEVAGMRLSELNLSQRTWLIPGERMKGGQPHLVPLPARAVELIEEALMLARDSTGMSTVCVFPSPHAPSKPIRPDSVTHAMAGICAAIGIADAAPHDLRRTGSTVMTSERLGISRFIRSKVLSHNSDRGGGAAVSDIHYDVNEYVAEKRRALEAWEELLLEIVGECVRPDNVHQFKAG
jgi:integrase